MWPFCTLKYFSVPSVGNGLARGEAEVGRAGGYRTISGKRQLWLVLGYWRGEQEVELNSNDK